MDEFYKRQYMKYGESKFLIGFCIFFSIVVNFLANLTIVVILGSELSIPRVIVYTIAYLFVGLLIGKMRVQKIKEDID